jgi:hypothetical protein
MDSKRDAQRRPDDVRHDGNAEHASVHEAKRDALRTDIAARLRRVCQHWADDEFAQLVSDMADTKLQFAAIEARAWPSRARDGRSTGNLPPPPADV